LLTDSRTLGPAEIKVKRLVSARIISAHKRSRTIGCGRRRTSMVDLREMRVVENSLAHVVQHFRHGFFLGLRRAVETQ
jgi:hypothetical protein